MKILEQGTVMITVIKQPDGTVRTTAVHQSSREEMAVYVDVEPRRFTALSCAWEIMRSPELPQSAGTIPELTGVEMHFAGSAAVRDLRGIAPGLRELLRECIRGIIQSEVFLQKERGYTDWEDYYEKCHDYFVDSCRYHSQPEKEVQSGREFIGEYVRSRSLFNRYKNYALSEEDEGACVLRGSFCDNYHEICAELRFDPEDGRIEKADSQFIRARGPVCFEMDALSGVLAGESVYDLNKKKIAGFLGGRCGCDHLVDIFSEMTRCATRHRAGRKPASCQKRA